MSKIIVFFVLIISFEAMGREWELKLNTTWACRRVKNADFMFVHPSSGGQCITQAGIKKLPESERGIKIYLSKDEIYKIEGGEKINYKFLDQNTYQTEIVDVRYPQNYIIPNFLLIQSFDCENDNIIYFIYPGASDPKVPPSVYIPRDHKKIEGEYFIECLRK